MARGLPGITYFSVFFGSEIAGDWEKNSLDGDLLARGLPGIGIGNYLTGDCRGLPGIPGNSEKCGQKIIFRNDFPENGK